MDFSRSRFWLVGILFSGAIVVGMGAEETLTVSAASSLSEPLRQLKTSYAMTEPAPAIILNFGGSGILQQQIAQGAPVDLFIAAAPRHIDALAQRNLIVPESRRDLLSNRLVLIAPADSKTVAGFADLASSKVRRIMMGDPKAVPAGAYAEQLLASLNLLKTTNSKTVRALDVRQVLTSVETGNVDAGFVYGTDAQLSKKVRVVAEAPVGSHAPIVYPMAIMKASRQRAAAERFAAYLQSAEGRRQFAQWGFIVPE